MNPIYKAWCRTYQAAFRLAIKIIPWRTPELYEGENKFSELAVFIKAKGYDNILVVTDKTLMSIGLLDPLFAGLKEENMTYFVYDETVPNPTIDNVEAGLKVYKDNNCKAIVAVGGGSAMDCAKIIGARAVKPRKSVSRMKGYFKILKALPPVFAVPTTSGTGSETTVSAVITDAKTHQKYAINDLNLIPKFAVLDPGLTVKLPKHVTSTTGMDALTHAVEAYIGKSNTKLTSDMAKIAVSLIFDNIQKAYHNGKNMAARSAMQQASYYAGVAFTRAYIGYVHAIAHTMGGLYNTPHGLANAIILPYVLDWYGESAYKPLAELAEQVKIIESEDTTEVRAKKFIQAIRDLNSSMQIPDKLSSLKEADFDIIIKRALKEANPNYPVPKIMDKNDMRSVLEKLTEPVKE